MVLEEEEDIFYMMPPLECDICLKTFCYGGDGYYIVYGFARPKPDELCSCCH
tara:strand:+ start:1141 stop:1296 length:156 start_codon:yes stop_codon:yes gene_type:complete